MAGFGSVSLAQTVVGRMLDQRAVVLYKQPEVDKYTGKAGFWRTVARGLWGRQFEYKELFAGLIDELGSETLSRIANVAGMNPYGITYYDAKVNIESELCDHPIETGALVTDASIVLPVSAEVTVAMPTLFAERIYEQMYKMFEEKKDKIILQTNYGLYRNLVLQNINYELTHDKVDRALFTLTLREVQERYVNDSAGEVASEKAKIAEASDATTVNTGSQMAIM
ncbi:MAG: hypothetical protein II304_05275 [Bacteroidales bacterium]|nr:hypothetical protein [Bacteroidales bacterium]